MYLDWKNQPHKPVEQYQHPSNGVFQQHSESNSLKQWRRKHLHEPIHTIFYWLESRTGSSLKSMFVNLLNK